MMVEIIETLKDIFKYILIIGAIILIRIYVLTTAEVIGSSMEPNLTDGNLTIVNQLSYHFKEIERFDIVVHKYDNPRYLIKRVIGLPGDTIKYSDNKLYVNGKEIEEPFRTDGDTEDFETIVPEDMYYVMGDHRDDSVDSRVFGAIKKKEIIGRPFFVIWPFDNFKFIK